MKKINMPTSPEGAIKSRARNLPIGTCYINSNWNQCKYATILVTRKHINGNLTFGGYEVDLYCLGVKDSFYRFNLPQHEFDELIRDYETEFITVDYKLAHNIIFSAIAFAEEYGFKPHKSFNVSKYILEDDEHFDDIEEIECGEDGIPVVFSSPQQPNYTVINKLEETAGAGNFIVYYVDDENEQVNIGDLYYEGTDDPEELFGDDDIESWEMDDYIKFFEGKKEVSLRTSKELVDTLFRTAFPDESFEESENTPQCKEIESLELDDFPEEKIRFNSESEKESLNEYLTELMSDKDNIDLKKYEQLVKKYPQNFSFYYLWYIACRLKDDNNKACEVLEKSISLFPDELFIATQYAFFMLSDEKTDKVEKYLKGRFFIKDYALSEKYSYQQAVDFYSVIAWYYLLKGNVQMADQYMFAINHIADHAKDYTLWKTTTLAIIKYKLEKLDQVKGNENSFRSML